MANVKIDLKETQQIFPMKCMNFRVILKFHNAPLTFYAGYEEKKQEQPVHRSVVIDESEKLKNMLNSKKQMYLQKTGRQEKKQESLNHGTIIIF